MAVVDHKARRAVLTLLQAVLELQDVLGHLASKAVDANDADAVTKLLDISRKVSSHTNVVLKIFDEPD